MRMHTLTGLKKIAGIRSVRHLFRKEVIIIDPDYSRLSSDLNTLNIDCRSYAGKKKLVHAPNYFRMWMGANIRDEDMVKINDNMERLVEEMSNTKYPSLLILLNNYPVIPVHFYCTPFPELLAEFTLWSYIPSGIVLLFPYLGFSLTVK